jgi:transcription elongation factor Elf1
MRTTDCQTYYDGHVTQADAYGNNVAWACPGCGHPILFVCLENQKGYDGRFTECKGCDESFTIRYESENTLVIEAAK